MLAAIVPLKKSRAPMTPPALTNREWVWKAIQRLSQTSKDPATTWSFGEVHREIQGAVVPGQTKRLLFYLSEQGDSGVRRFRVRGKKNDGRTHWFNRYRYDQPVLSWNGVQRKDLSAWLPFREQKNMAMAEFLTSDLGGEISELSRQLALAPANDDRERILRLAVQEMLLAYDILRIPRREWTYQKLLKTLTTKRGKLLLNTSDSLARGLEWLERQGFPVLLSRSGGLVSGAVVLDIRTPDLTSVKDGDESQAAIAQRIDLALAARGLQWQVIDEMGTAAGQNWDFTAQMIKLRAGKIDHEETIDRLLLELSRILGRPPIWFRTGLSRSEYADVLSRKLPSMTIGERARAFRHLAGLSKAALAARISRLMGKPFNVQRIIYLEKDPNFFAPDQSNLLNRPEALPQYLEALEIDDPFQFLAGIRESETRFLLSPAQRIKVRRLGCGIGQGRVASELGVTIVSVNTWERGKGLPVRRTRPRLAELLSCNAEDLFSRFPTAVRRYEGLQLSRTGQLYLGGRLIGEFPQLPGGVVNVEIANGKSLSIEFLTDGLGNLLLNERTWKPVVGEPGPGTTWEYPAPIVVGLEGLRLAGLDPRVLLALRTACQTLPGIPRRTRDDLKKYLQQIHLSQRTYLQVGNELSIPELQQLIQLGEESMEVAYNEAHYRLLSIKTDVVRWTGSPEARSQIRGTEVRLMRPQSGLQTVLFIPLGRLTGLRATQPQDVIEEPFKDPQTHGSRVKGSDPAGERRGRRAA